MITRGVAAAATALFVGAMGCRQSTGPTVHEHQVIELEASALTRVRLSMGAGELDVKGGASKLVEADFSYNVPPWKPSMARTSEGTTTDIAISQASEAGSFDSAENHWQIALNDATPLEVITHLGAGEARMKLGSLNLRNVELHMGAGEVDVDLRGAPTTSYKVNIQGGVGTATVHVPATVAISAAASGGIGDIKVTGLEQRDGRWINPRVMSSPVTIDLEVHGGVGSIEIVAE